MSTNVNIYLKVFIFFFFLIRFFFFLIYLFCFLFALFSLRWYSYCDVHACRIFFISVEQRIHFSQNLLVLYITHTFSFISLPLHSTYYAEIGNYICYEILLWNGVTIKKNYFIWKIWVMHYSYFHFAMLRRYVIGTFSIEVYWKWHAFFKRSFH